MSDNQEDELLARADEERHEERPVVGTESGVLGIFSWGDWGDVSDRLLGHPQSVDAVVPINDDVLLSALSDGILLASSASTQPRARRRRRAPRPPGRGDRAHRRR